MLLTLKAQSAATTAQGKLLPALSNVGGGSDVRGKIALVRYSVCTYWPPRFGVRLPR